MSTRSQQNLASLKIDLRALRLRMQRAAGTEQILLLREVEALREQFVKASGRERAREANAARKARRNGNGARLPKVIKAAGDPRSRARLQ